VEKYPQLADVFLDFGVHCVGCYVSSYETIEQGILGHGFSEEELDEFLKEINTIIRDPSFSLS
ncbi:DUF1858 domain-containing protein, partial [Candidatus Peregrinibacteria bacterium]|nr:DUF1858 domain-containing protein [Candidatus Peregrinibacteria bacterium]